MSVTPNPWHDFSAPQVLEDGSATVTYAEMAESSEPAEPAESAESDDKSEHREMLTKALGTIAQQSELIGKLMEQLTKAA